MKLWRYVVKDAEPIRDTPSAPEREASLKRSEKTTATRGAGPSTPAAAGKPAPPSSDDIPPPPGKAAQKPTTRRLRPSPPAEAPGTAFQPRQPSPDVSGLDRRTRQKLQRGQVEIEARLDLHGLRQHEAHETLRKFIAGARAQGLRCVLVITGKGASPYARHTLHSGAFYQVPERSGVLRQLLPQWLAEPRLADHVTGFQPAHPRHGGGGAFYIWLRRKRLQPPRG